MFVYTFLMMSCGNTCTVIAKGPVHSCTYGYSLSPPSPQSTTPRYDVSAMPTFVFFRNREKLHTVICTFAEYIILYV